MKILPFFLSFLFYLPHVFALAQAYSVGQVGQIDLAGVASLTVPEKLVFVPAQSFRSPFRSSCDSTAYLGFLVSRYHSDSVAPLVVEILYTETDYVSENTILKTCAKAFFDEICLLNQSQNVLLKEKGCDTFTISHWAMEPYFLEAEKQLQWAVFCQYKDTGFVWYSIKKMGRHGFLELNIRTSMAHLTQLKPLFPALCSSISFHKGFRHQDFDPQIDKLAVSGIAGIFAGEVLTKANVVPLAIKWLKWIILAILALFTFFRKKILQKELQHAEDESNPT